MGDFYIMKVDNDPADPMLSPSSCEMESFPGPLSIHFLFKTKHFLALFFNFFFCSRHLVVYGHGVEGRDGIPEGDAAEAGPGEGGVSGGVEQPRQLILATRD